MVVALKEQEKSYCPMLFHKGVWSIQLLKLLIVHSVRSRDSVFRVSLHSNVFMVLRCHMIELLFLGMLTVACSQHPATERQSSFREVEKVGWRVIEVLLQLVLAVPKNLYSLIYR